MYGNARLIVANSWSEGIAPDPDLSIAEWGEANIQIPSESSPNHGALDLSLTPYLFELLECLHPDNPATLVVAKKGAQLGFTLVGIVWMGYTADVAQAPSMVIQPSVEMGKKFISTKLNPIIEATPVLRHKIHEQKSRDGTGSTTQYGC